RRSSHVAASPRPRVLRLLVLLALAGALPLFAADPARPLVTSVDSVAMTVSDLDRTVDFYTRVLDFQKISEVEVAGPAYERVEGVFGLRMRVARLKLGEEFVELVEFLAPHGRPVPQGLRSNDRSFQHIAIIVRDMDAAYKRLRENHVAHLSSGPQRLPDWNKNAGGIQAFYFADPDGHPLEVLAFPPEKGAAEWHPPTDRLF